MNNSWIKKDNSNTDVISEILGMSDFITIRIEGKNVQTKEDFFVQVEKALCFPLKCDGMFSRFEDWITDLSWLPKEKGVCLIINEYDEFLKKEFDNKEIIEDIFKNNVLSFWEEGVLKYVKGGKPRKFFIIES